MPGDAIEDDEPETGYAEDTPEEDERPESAAMIEDPQVEAQSRDYVRQGNRPNADQTSRGRRLKVRPFSWRRQRFSGAGIPGETQRCATLITGVLEAGTHGVAGRANDVAVLRHGVFWLVHSGNQTLRAPGIIGIRRAESLAQRGIFDPHSIPHRDQEWNDAEAQSEPIRK